MFLFLPLLLLLSLYNCVFFRSSNSPRCGSNQVLLLVTTPSPTERFSGTVDSSSSSFCGRLHLRICIECQVLYYSRKYTYRAFTPPLGGGGVPVQFALNKFPRGDKRNPGTSSIQREDPLCVSYTPLMRRGIVHLGGRVISLIHSCYTNRGGICRGITLYGSASLQTWNSKETASILHFSASSAETFRRSEITEELKPFPSLFFLQQLPRSPIAVHKLPWSGKEGDDEGWDEDRRGHLSSFCNLEQRERKVPY